MKTIKNSDQKHECHNTPNALEILILQIQHLKLVLEH